MGGLFGKPKRNPVSPTAGEPAHSSSSSSSLSIASSSSPSSSSSSGAKELHTFTKAELRRLNDEELDKFALGGSIELRRYNNMLVAMKVNAVPNQTDFQRNLLAITRFSSHPCIAEILGVHKGETGSFVVAEYVHGQSLDHWLNSSHMFTWDQILTFAIQICNAMIHTHTSGLVHRNLKPSNVIILEKPTPDGVLLKVIDFGLARQLGDDVTKKRGPVQYTAPEIFENSTGDYTHAVDCYSFGVMLNQMMTRKEPFHIVALAQVPLEVRSGARPEIAQYTPPRLAELIKKLWSQEPKNRGNFEKAKEVLTQLLKSYQTSPKDFPALESLFL